MCPFANFVANGDVTLYAHPELLDDATRLLLLNPKTTKSSTESTSTTETTEGLSKPTTTMNQKKQPKEKHDDNDGFVL